MQQKLKITIIGAGNVGSHLARGLYDSGHKIIQIFSRSLPKARLVAEKIKAQACNTLRDISSRADLYIIATKDDSIESVAEQLQFLNKYQKLIVHTSGATNSKVIGKYHSRYGVFYPLQSFSTDQKVVWEHIPFCLWAAQSQDLQILKNITKSLEAKYYVINDEQRQILHISAVFVNNFTNHLFNIAHKICQQQDVRL